MFFQTTDSIEAGVGFSHFDVLHICWLFFALAVFVICSLHYRRISAHGKKRWRKSIAILLLIDELFKVIVLVCTGQYNASFLPLHLCSINIFIIALHAYRPSKTLSGFLYTVCIPGTMAALLFPSWTALPFWNAMHLHSFTVHILLALYPIVLTVNGELEPSVFDIPKSLGLLILMAVPIYAVNLLLNTNYMFLMFANEGNPLYWFAKNWGSHLWGFPVITVCVLLVMYFPMALYRLCYKKSL